MKAAETLVQYKLVVLLGVWRSLVMRADDPQRDVYSLQTLIPSLLIVCEEPSC